MRQLATVQIISGVEPIPGADSIEVVHVKGWQCVAKKGEFKEGDRCVYFEIDSLLPSANPIFDFLSKGAKEKTMTVEGVEYKGFRLKTIRLRGQLSQGLALPLSMFPELQTVVGYNDEGDVYGFDDLQIGQDVSQALSVVKYEPPIPAVLSGIARGTFPSFIPKTDEERIQNCATVLEDWEGDSFYVTEKLDGSSMTVFKAHIPSIVDVDPLGPDDVGATELHVCSRNMDLAETEGNTFWKVARDLDLVNKVPPGIAIQGELVGEGIQGNPLGLKGHHFHAFSVYIIGAGRFMDFGEMTDFLREKNIPIVPVLSDGLPLENDLRWLLRYADGPSQLNPNAKREGVVFRPRKESKYRVPRGMDRLSFKIISNDYLLSQE